MDEQSHMYELEFPGPSVSDTDGNGPVLVHALDGYADAGHALRLLRQHLKDNLTTELVASFDVDELIDYRSRRPSMTFEDGFTGVDEPELNLYAVRDSAGKPFLLLAGAEPDLRWNGFVSAVAGLAERFGVRTVVGLHAIPMAVPHTRPVPVTAHGNNPALRSELRSWDGGTMRLPGSAAGMLELRLADKGYDTLGLSVHVPHYLAQNDYPEAVLGMLGALRSSVDLQVPDGELPVEAAELREQIDAQVSSSAEISSVVETLEQQYDEAVAQPRELLIADGETIPTGDDLASEFEAFLAEQAGDEGENGSAS
ncbi:proteasome protein [Tsukamurella pulmonis]|uniref:proteasome assembly chaperone family protein n=1 Tax=Tsukamurella pulmonis TaxID=47312 RepID=UPI000791FB80|nr:PAC2 family protein [Tsukamurella pulmonis]KXP09678.1 proteasome protein [Tsukamurella pulmonis]RDH09381.1 PAC2 family protein [Tsukamurella pulmonis]